MKMIVAILPAAGTGERVGSSLPKQYIAVNGHPLVYHTLSSFLKVEIIDLIVLVCNSQFEDFVRTHVLTCFSVEEQKRVKLTPGGDTRHRSIAAGLNYFSDKEKPDIVIVHDAVRPFVDGSLLRSLVDAAAECGAAGPVCKLTSTVLKARDDNLMDHALHRDLYRNSEMPQVFRYSAIRTAYDKCSEWDYLHGTECLHLVRQYTDYSVKLIDGRASNLFKVTYKRDIYAVEGLLKESQQVALVSFDANPELVENIKATLKNRFKFVTDGQSVTIAVDILIVIVEFVERSDLETKLRQSLELAKNKKTIYVLISPNENQMAECLRKQLDSNGHGWTVGITATPLRLTAKRSKLIQLVCDLAWNFTSTISGQVLHI